MNICIAGWYLEEFEDFYKNIKSVKDKFNVFIVSNKKSSFLEKLGLPYCVRENTGLEWGAYNHYLMNIWESGDTLFCHDDIVLGEIPEIETDFDQAYIFNNRQEMIENLGMHGRMVYMTDSFLSKAKKIGGFFYDKYNRGYTNADDIELKKEFGCSYYNAGIRCFYDMAEEIGEKVNGAIYLDSINLCKRGDRENMDKYDPKGSFCDPVVRCFRCHTVLRTEQLLRLGVCSKCGGRKVSNVTILNEEELEQIKKWDLDPEYIAEWGSVDE